jgi:methionyl-tRNA formyltransferase
MKIIYFGTPDFAVKPLEKLIENFEVVAVVTQPDRPVGRSNKPVPCAVKQCAMNHNIPVLQYEKIRLEGVEDLKALNADMMVSCAYGQIFSKEILDITPLGMYNIHGSILPKYRGSAPIQWSIINGEEYCGITILKTDVGMDDGDILLTKPVKIKENETSGELFDRLSEVGAEVIIEAIHLLETGEYFLTPQNHEEATKCKMLTPEMSTLDFSKPAQEVVNMIHGINPWPVAKVEIAGSMFKVFRAKVREDFSGNIGEILVASNKQGLIIACGKYAVEFDEIQPNNGKRMPAKSYLNGKVIPVGEIVK